MLNHIDDDEEDEKKNIIEYDDIEMYYDDFILDMEGVDSTECPICTLNKILDKDIVIYLSKKYYIKIDDIKSEIRKKYSMQQILHAEMVGCIDYNVDKQLCFSKKRINDEFYDEKEIEKRLKIGIKLSCIDCEFKTLK